MKIILNEKKISKVKAQELFGKETLKRYIQEAKELLYEDPDICNATITRYGILEIEF